MSKYKLPIAIALAFGLMSFGMSGCTNSDRARYALKNESEDNYGVMRTVTAYGTTGELIGQWHGKIDVQYADGSSDYTKADRVDIVLFDGSTPIDRIIISGAIVIVDND